MLLIGTRDCAAPATITSSHLPALTDILQASCSMPLSVAFLANWRIVIWNRYLWVFCQHEDIFKQNFYIYHGSDGIEQIL